LDKDNPRRYYINFGVDPSGNLIAALVGLFDKSKNTAEDPIKIFGQPISQFSRGRADLRYYSGQAKNPLWQPGSYPVLGFHTDNLKLCPI
jgi:hypothetical protein